MPEKIFADEATKRGWELCEKVNQIVQSLPPQGPKLEFQAIAFSRRYSSSGLDVVYTAGTVIGTGLKGAMLVPKRTREILDQLNIPYRVIDLAEE